MYPSRIINRGLYPQHLGPEWLEGYKWTFDERVHKWKKLAKKDIVAATYNEVYKLSLNGGGFGKTNEPNSWQYDPKVAFSTTLDNQFLLLMLAEKAMLMGVDVLSLNTDGILCKVKYSQKEEYDNICKEWEKLTGFILEETIYKKFIQTSVNDYIAQTTSGDIKYKGDFEIDKEIHKNKSKRIIPIALKEYFINNIPVETTIKNHNNLFDFCIGVRTTGNTKLKVVKIKDFNVEYEELPKTIRYFISKSGSCIYKFYEDGSKEILNKHPQNGRTWYQTILNKYDESLLPSVNHSYYMYETNKIIRQIIK